MTRNEFNRAYTIACSDAKLPPDDGLFMGFGLADFKPVKCTLRQVAALMRWQALQLNGEWDVPALHQIADQGRYKFDIIGADSDDMIALKEALKVSA